MAIKLSEVEEKKLYRIRNKGTGLYVGIEGSKPFGYDDRNAKAMSKKTKVGSNPNSFIWYLEKVPTNFENQNHFRIRSAHGGFCLKVQNNDSKHGRNIVLRDYYSTKDKSFFTWVFQEFEEDESNPFDFVILNLNGRYLSPKTESSKDSNPIVQKKFKSNDYFLWEIEPVYDEEYEYPSDPGIENPDSGTADDIYSIGDYDDLLNMGLELSISMALDAAGYFNVGETTGTFFTFLGIMGQEEDPTIHMINAVADLIKAIPAQERMKDLNAAADSIFEKYYDWYVEKQTPNEIHTLEYLFDKIEYGDDNLRDESNDLMSQYKIAPELFETGGTLAYLNFAVNHFSILYNMIDLYYKINNQVEEDYWRKIKDDMDDWIGLLEKRWPEVLQNRLGKISKHLLSPLTMIVDEDVGSVLGSKLSFDAYKDHVELVFTLKNGKPLEVLQNLKDAREKALDANHSWWEFT